MTLRDLEYFVTIAHEKNITRAASTLFVAQPALSQCIRKLEKEIGFELFIRNSSGVILTDEGSCFLQFAERVLCEKITLNRQIRDIENSDSGEVRLGFSGSQAAFVLPHILPEFRQKHPKVIIHLCEGTSDEVETSLVRGEIDLAILHAPVLHKEIDCFEVAIDEMVVVPRIASNYHDFISKSAEDDRRYICMDFFRTEPVAMTHPGQRSRMICDQIFANAGIIPTILQTSRNLSTLDALAQIDYVSVLLPRKQLSSSLLCRDFFYLPSEYSVSYPFVVAVHRGSYLPIAARSLYQAFYAKRYLF